MAADPALPLEETAQAAFYFDAAFLAAYCW
jgi:hypothetical protein